MNEQNMVHTTEIMTFNIYEQNIVYHFLGHDLWHCNILVHEENIVHYFIGHDL